MFARKLDLKTVGSETFFLWGSRQTGKSTLLRQQFPDAHVIDLLNNNEFAKYQHSPASLFAESEEIERGRRIIIDEIQKVPRLLDEVHRLIETRGRSFGLCGSSARKLRRGHANLLGGRALRFELFGLVSPEVGKDFDLLRFINHGVLPKHYTSPQVQRLLRSYVSDYLREEIAAEGLVRNLPAFSDFLRVAAIGDTEIVSYENIARECGVSAVSIKSYYEILEDTLLGSFLPSYTQQPKRRVIQAPKFYMRNGAVVGHLAKRGALETGSELFGKAFENWIVHEIMAQRAYSEADFDMYYWRTASGIEIDVVLGNAKIGIEVKSVPRVQAKHLNGLLAFREDHPEVRELILVCLEERARKLENGIRILPVRTFLKALWDGEFIPT